MLKKKTEWRKKTPGNSDTIGCICDFPLDSEYENGWFDHIAKSENSFLRNLYSESEIKSMNISCIEDYKDILFRLLNIHHPFEKALEDGVINDKIRDLWLKI